MSVVWKFPLRLAKAQTVSMPSGARFLSVQIQGADGLMLWAEVDPERPRVARQIEIWGTGDPLVPAARRAYLATVQEPPFVWHFYAVDDGDGEPVR
jgi:hypothetical protein